MIRIEQLDLTLEIDDTGRVNLPPDVLWSAAELKIIARAINKHIREHNWKKEIDEMGSE